MIVRIASRSSSAEPVVVLFKVEVSQLVLVGDRDRLIFLGQKATSGGCYEITICKLVPSLLHSCLVVWKSLEAE